ncbi:recombinase family protein [Nocardia sp. NPDC023852]|uniref:recombinase family protein n=1 Tax=Nocardia sp. NPDC023852 TaxID=3154697 RepID=UPI0033E483DE
MLIGYGRVSTAHQIDALGRAGVEESNIHIDTASGAKSSRPKLDLVLALARTGDTIVITRLDRLGRSVLHLIALGADLRARHRAAGRRAGHRHRYRRGPRHVRPRNSEVAQAAK